MTYSKRLLWNRYCEYRYDAPEIGLTLDISRVRFEDDYFTLMSSPITAAMDAMEALEAGAIANSDEHRMVGHYWLRNPDMAPVENIGLDIKHIWASIRLFAAQLHEGAIRGVDGPFEHVIHVGIGGSALGAQFLCEALQTSADRVALHFLDNADPDGIDSLLESLDGALGRTLTSVVSKSGLTPTPHYVLLELKAAYERQGLDFARHTVATTMKETDLDRQASREEWLARFPIWEWVGGRTSITSAVGLLPAALQGIDIDPFLAGAAAMDRLTRLRNPRANPAALLALMWYWLGNGRGDKAMVVLPYKDRLALFPRYIQQLAMESLGKKLNRAGAIVHQGLTVYGNKGSTDQHAYVQQLRDGIANFFVLFISVHKDRTRPAIHIVPELTLGDYLFGSLEGTRNALYERGRNSITVSLADVTPFSLGALVALFERAIGLYAELINVNAYHQPGVDKWTADGVGELQRVVLAHLKNADAPLMAEEIAHSVEQKPFTERFWRSRPSPIDSVLIKRDDSED